MAIRSVAAELEDIYRDFGLTVDRTALSVHSANGPRQRDIEVIENASSSRVELPFDQISIPARSCVGHQASGHVTPKMTKISENCLVTGVAPPLWMRS